MLKTKVSREEYYQIKGIFKNPEVEEIEFHGLIIKRGNFDVLEELARYYRNYGGGTPYTMSISGEKNA